MKSAALTGVYMHALVIVPSDELQGGHVRSIRDNCLHVQQCMRNVGTTSAHNNTMVTFHAQ